MPWLSRLYSPQIAGIEFLRRTAAQPPRQCPQRIAAAGEYHAALGSIERRLAGQHRRRGSRTYSGAAGQDLRAVCSLQRRIGRPGNGLGLAICRSIVKLHRGKSFAVEGQDGHGLRLVARFRRRQRRPENSSRARHRLEHRMSPCSLAIRLQRRPITPIPCFFAGRSRQRERARSQATNLMSDCGVRVSMFFPRFRWSSVSAANPSMRPYRTHALRQVLLWQEATANLHRERDAGVR
jgi:hypothetical protein